jgi:hypothetical protein
MENWDKEIKEFIVLSFKHNVRMLMVGGGAVNFHGYQRHSADIDFWIETTDENFRNLIQVFKAMDYEIEDFPPEVKNQMQNISLKFSPQSLNIELITRFSVNKSFEQAYLESELVEIDGVEFFKWRVLSLNDLITSKIKSGRPKDLLDIQQLTAINKL